MADHVTHWIRPLQSRPITGRHLLLYTSEVEKRRRVVAGVRHLWCADVRGGGWECRLVDGWTSTAHLDYLLGDAVAEKGSTTVWVMRGWTDLVTTGLAELMDSGAITWRYASLQGQLCLIRGAWRQRSIVISALGNWTGGRWDSLKGLHEDQAVARFMTGVALPGANESLNASQEELSAVRTLAAIVSSCDMLSIKTVPPTAAAAGLLCWRTWLAPTVQLVAAKAHPSKNLPQVAPARYCIPLPRRTNAARESERHVCYGLVNRQLRCGRVEGPLYCLDVRSAYLLGLATTTLPAAYYRSYRRITPEQFIPCMVDKTGLALVRLNTTDSYYPCRVNQRIIPCRGSYWTWLAGAELAVALCLGHVQEVWAAHLWHGMKIGADAATILTMISRSLEATHMPALQGCWRAVYSSMIGRFAGWHKVWNNTPAAAGYGRWATWDQADPNTGQIVPYRSIAGQVQLLKEKVDKSDSVPLLFGCVTAAVRWFIASLAEVAEWKNVVSIASDSLWLTSAGWQNALRRCSECGIAGDNLLTKDIWDRAWMNGRSICVVERDGQRVLHMPGVHRGQLVDPDGLVIMRHTDNWTASSAPEAAAGVGVWESRYNAQALVDRYDHEATVIPPGETVDIPLLDQYLLQPIRGSRSIDDA